MIGLAVVARQLVLVLLTEKWLSCVPFLQLLCVVGLLYPLYSINLNVLAAQGRSDLVLKLEVISKVFQVIAIAVTFRWGITALIFGQIVMSILTFAISTFYTGQILEYPFSKQIKDYIPAFISAIIMGAGVWGVGLIQLYSTMFQLAFQVTCGVFFYVIICHILKPSFFMENQKIAKDFFSSSVRLCIKTFSW